MNLAIDDLRRTKSYDLILNFTTKALAKYMQLMDDIVVTLYPKDLSIEDFPKYAKERNIRLVEYPEFCFLLNFIERYNLFLVYNPMEESYEVI